MLGVRAGWDVGAAGTAAGNDERAVDVVEAVFLGDALRERKRLAHVDVGHLAAVGADQMVVFFQRRFVFGGAAGVGEDLDQADAAQDIERAVDRSEADAGQLRAGALEDRLRAEVASVFQGTQNCRALLRQPVPRLQESCIYALGILHSPPSNEGVGGLTLFPGPATIPGFSPSPKQRYVE